MAEDGLSKSEQSAVQRLVPSMPGWLSSPKRFIRGVIFGTLLSGIAAVVTPVFTAIQLVFLGSNASTFAADSETLGLVDLPVFLADAVGGAAGGLIRGVFNAIASVIAAAVPQVPGPVEGVIAALVFAIMGVVVVRLVLPAIQTALQAGLEAIPVVGGPLSTIIGKL